MLELPLARGYKRGAADVGAPMESKTFGILSMHPYRAFFRVLNYLAVYDTIVRSCLRG